jgi:purine-binding chemotaxis protein CheW
VTLSVAEQLFGVSVLGVRAIMRAQPVTRIPLAPPEIAGSLNLRGRIVTAIDLRRRLRLPPAPSGPPPMSVVTERDGELYALQVDQVCEVLRLDIARFERTPPTLSPDRAVYCTGLYRLETTLMLVLDLERLLTLPWEVA